MDKLHHGENIWAKDRPLWSKTFVWTTNIKCHTNYMVVIYEWIWLLNSVYKGKENHVVDALNKRAHEMHISSINMFNTNLKDIILEAANLDQRYLKIIESLQQDNINKKLIIMS